MNRQELLTAAKVFRKEFPSAFSRDDQAAEAIKQTLAMVQIAEAVKKGDIELMKVEPEWQPPTTTSQPPTKPKKVAKKKRGLPGTKAKKLDDTKEVEKEDDDKPDPDVKRVPRTKKKAAKKAPKTAPDSVKKKAAKKAPKTSDSESKTEEKAGSVADLVQKEES